MGLPEDLGGCGEVLRLIAFNQINVRAALNLSKRMQRYEY